MKTKLEGYLAKAQPMFENLEVESGSDAIFQNKEKTQKIVEEFRMMALSYYNDAKHFHENGECINALAALEYAEGWLDAGRLLGFFKIKNHN